MIEWFGLALVYEKLERRGIKGWRAIVLLWALIVIVLLVVLYLKPPP